MKKTIIFLLFLSIFSCKTQEQIRREQLVDTMSMQMGESQKLNADNIVRIEELEERLNHIQGSIDTTSHEGQQKRVSFNERLQALEELQKEINEQQIGSKMGKSRTILKKVEQLVVITT